MGAGRRLCPWTATLVDDVVQFGGVYFFRSFSMNVIVDERVDGALFVVVCCWELRWYRQVLAYVCGALMCQCVDHGWGSCCVCRLQGKPAIICFIFGTTFFLFVVCFFATFCSSLAPPFCVAVSLLGKRY